MFKSMADTGIRTRLLGGFALLAATVIYTVSVVSDISSRIKHVVDRRAPIAIASTELVGNLYSTLSTLRGYLLTGDEQAKRDRASVWTELDRTAAAVDRMAEGFSNAQNEASWREAKALIAEFRQAQDRAEMAAFTPSAYPASDLLAKEAAPLIATMFAKITGMIDEEESGGDAAAQALAQDLCRRSRQPRCGRIAIAALRRLRRGRRPRQVRKAACDLQGGARIGQDTGGAAHRHPEDRLPGHRQGERSLRAAAGEDFRDSPDAAVEHAGLYPVDRSRTACRADSRSSRRQEGGGRPARGRHQERPAVEARRGCPQRGRRDRAAAFAAMDTARRGACARHCDRDP